MSKKDKKPDNSQESRRIQADRDYFERVEGDIYIGASPSGDPTALRDAYLHGLIRKAGYVPLADIDPQMAAAEQDTPLNLDAIYTALLTISPEEQDLLRTGEGRPEHRKSALQQLNDFPALVLLGGPGSGKSTFVNFVTICLAGEWLGREDINLDVLRTPLPGTDEKKPTPPQPWQHGVLLPVRVILREFAAEGLPGDGEAVTGKHLWQFIAKELEQEGLGDFVPQLECHLRKHGGLLLLDGLDEVPDTERLRPAIKQAVEGCCCLFPRCRLLVTSRTYAYQRHDWKLSGFAETVLSTFTNEQIQTFVRHWYMFLTRFRDMSQTDALAQADELYGNIRANSRLRELAERPILLTLMTSLHASRGKLPEKRVELYQETVGLLLHRWEWQKFKRSNAEGKIITEYQSLLRWLDLDRDKVLALLGKLAYEAHAAQPAVQKHTAYIEEHKLVMGLWHLRKSQQVNVEQLEQHLRDRAGILITPADGLYTFPHRSFQEYLAARYLTGEQDYPDNMADLVREDPNRWREVTLLAAASAANVAPMIWLLVEALCFREVTDPHVIPEDAWGALLAGQTLVETANLEHVRPQNQPKLNRVKDWLEAILTEQQPKETPFPVMERALAGNILAQIGDPRPGVGLREDGLPDIERCKVPVGTFLMGSNKANDPEAYGDEQPQHEVHISTYQISRYPLTNAQYRAFVEDGGYTDKWKNCWTPEGWGWKEQKKITEPEMYGGAFDLPNHPVVGVSWYEAVAFCAWLTQHLRESGELSENQEIRLPTEAEWEKAARGTDGRIYPWGNEKITPEFVNYNETGLGATSTVGCFPRGKSPYGCEDLSGNVREWCLDWFDENYYSLSPKENPQGPESGSARVFRGGSWINVAGIVRSAYRSRYDPGGRDYDVGFRLLRTPL